MSKKEEKEKQEKSKKKKKRGLNELPGILNRIAYLSVSNVKTHENEREKNR